MRHYARQHWQVILIVATIWLAGWMANRQIFATVRVEITTSETRVRDEINASEKRTNARFDRELLPLRNDLRDIRNKLIPNSYREVENAGAFIVPIMGGPALD